MSQWRRILRYCSYGQNSTKTLNCSRRFKGVEECPIVDYGIPDCRGSSRMIRLRAGMIGSPIQFRGSAAP